MASLLRDAAANLAGRPGAAGHSAPALSSSSNDSRGVGRRELDFIKVIEGSLKLYLSVAALAISSQSYAQSGPKAPLAFEVTSVKPSEPGANGGGIRPLPGGQTYVASNVPLRLMIKLMYKINDSQIVGGPGWMNDELYDVEGKAESPSTLDQLHEMFQTLLADRFKLQFHRETREQRAYVLTVDRGGSKLKVNSSPEPFDIPIKPEGRGKIVGTRVPMSYFCWFMSQRLNEPVLDQTGLTGFYDFTLEIVPRDEPFRDAPGGPVNPGMNQPPQAEVLAVPLREQLGLKLESRKAPVDVFVIDHVERPAAN